MLARKNSGFSVDASVRYVLPRHLAQKPGPSSSRSTFDRAIFQASPDELPDIDIHSL